jgi:hypothetical protein
VVLSIMHQFLEKPQVSNLIHTRQIYIVPSLNPDGAEYDITGGSYHYWRKNRQPYQGVYGTDQPQLVGGRLRRPDRGLPDEDRRRRLRHRRAEAGNSALERLGPDERFAVEDHDLVLVRDGRAQLCDRLVRSHLEYFDLGRDRVARPHGRAEAPVDVEENAPGARQVLGDDGVQEP